MVSESNVIFSVYIGYTLATVTFLSWRPTLQAALAAMFLGWLYLPVEVYPAETITVTGFTVEVIGTGLPSSVLVTKALVVPLAVFVGVAIGMPQWFRDLRLSAVDLGMAAFCLTPVLSYVAGKLSVTQTLAQTAYLTGVWGGTWVIGRALLSSRQGLEALTGATIASGLALLPFAIVEGVRPPWFYSAVYGSHPFQLEGAWRYVGYRPIGFFEHGNQYGIWIAMAALAAVYRCRDGAPNQRSKVVIAIALVSGAVASQSLGALILLALGCAWLTMTKQTRRYAVIASGLLLAVGGAAYTSGSLPIERWALETRLGQNSVAALRTIGRLSIAYRVRRDQMAVSTILREPLTGYGAWDWWRPLKSHPWGLPLLIAGQYGLISLMLISVVLLAGPLRQLSRGRSSLMGLIVILAAADAWLNSFIYFPAILASAALAVPLRKNALAGGREAGVKQQAQAGTRRQQDERHEI